MSFISRWINGVHFSLGNRKVGRIASVSLLPVVSCVPGVPCAKVGQCYALKIVKMYRATRAAYRANTKMAINNRVRFFGAVRLFLEQYEGEFFRWHVSGDILDQDYFDSMVTVARLFSRVRFLVFTKRYALDFSQAPDNLSVIISRWPGYDCKLRKLPRCWVYDPKNPDPKIPSDAIHCPGGCESCGACWSLKSIGRDVVIHKH